jgi:hypothetical protein
LLQHKKDLLYQLADNDEHCWQLAVIFFYTRKKPFLGFGVGIRVGNGLINVNLWVLKKQ